MWSILLQIYEAVRSSVRTTPSLPSVSLSLSRVYSLFACMSCHLAYRRVHTIAFTYELNYYMQLPMDCVAAVNLARCPLNNERMIRDKLSNGENDLNHAERPPSSPPPSPPAPPPPCRVMDRSIFDVPYYWCLTSNRFES